MYYVTIIQPNGETTMARQPTVPDYHQLQSAVGGLIEIVPRFETYKGKPCVAFCNEEGKLTGLDDNWRAQMLWKDQVFGIRDYLVGPVCIVSADSAAELGEL